MEKIVKLISGYKTYITFFACILLSVLIILSNQSPQVLTLRALLVDVSSVMTAPVSYSAKVFSALEENRILKAENIRLSLENSKMRDHRDRITELRKLLDLKNRSDFRFRFGTIIQWGTVPVASTITIDLGRNSGIHKNDPVVTSEGLVGKVLKAGARTAVCQLLTDRNFKVSAMTRNTGAFGHLRWQKNNMAIMDNVNKSSTVTVGDTVVTSQHGNIYPEGIPIGVVHSYEDGPELFKYVNVRLFVDYLQLRDIAVIVDASPDTTVDREFQ